MITVTEDYSLAKKRKIANKKKVINKRKKQAKTPTLEPETLNDSKDEYSEWDKVHE